jgi:ActR/RegA family two-component response regulator/anti-sigma regulatory factor (Ser/Thr protein kinase)
MTLGGPLTLEGSRVSKRTVLVVDDEDLLRSFLGVAIGALGVAIESASSGTEALEQIRRKAPDVVVTDLRMRGMSGLELLEQARPFAPETAFIVVTGFGTLGDAVTAGKLGAVEFLPKPFDASAIRAAVKRALDARPGRVLGPVAGTLRCEFAVPSDPGLRAAAFTVFERLVAETGAGLDVSARAAFRFCVLETLLNAMQHGHRFERERAVRFRAEISPGAITCEVEDEGEGYTPPAEPVAGRHGLALVRALMDEVSVDLGGRRIRFTQHRDASAQRKVA